MARVGQAEGPWNRGAEGAWRPRRRQWPISADLNGGRTVLGFDDRGDWQVGRDWHRSCGIGKIGPRAPFHLPSCTTTPHNLWQQPRPFCRRYIDPKLAMIRRDFTRHVAEDSLEDRSRF